MELIRNWAVQVAGITVLAAVCDIIMPRGGTEKYVRMVMGFVLILALIRPLTAFSPNKLIEGIGGANTAAAELGGDLSGYERGKVLGLYRQKLAESMAETLGEAGIAAVEIETETEEDGENFGAVKSITALLASSADVSDTERAKRILCEKYNVDVGRVSVSCAETDGRR